MATETKKNTSAKKAARPAKAAPEAAAPNADTRSAMDRRRQVVGVVVSDKMQKTIVVRTDRKVKHALYKKYVMRSRNVKAHDEKNDAKPGDLVQLVESRPLSKDKRWVLARIVRRAAQVSEANV